MCHCKLSIMRMTSKLGGDIVISKKKENVSKFFNREEAFEVNVYLCEKCGEITFMKGNKI